MLTCSWYILWATAACGFQCPGWRATDAEDSLGIGQESHTNRSNWGQSGEEGDAGDVLAKGAEVSQDCWMFRWWHGTHGESSAAANASCPPGRSVGGSNRVTANRHTETSQDLQNTTVQWSSTHTSMLFILTTTCCSQWISPRKFTLSSIGKHTLFNPHHSRNNHEKRLLQAAQTARVRLLGKYQHLWLMKQIKFLQSNLINSPPTL